MQEQDSPNTEKRVCLTQPKEISSTRSLCPAVRDGSCRGALPGAERVQVTCERFEFCGSLTP